MKVARGWSAEVPNSGWTRGDIEVDESDLQRLLAENEIDLDFLNKITTKDAFGLLESEVERLILTQLVHLKVLSVEDYKSQVGKWDSLKDKILDKAKESHIAF